MNHIKEYFKKNWPYFCAFFLPFFIMFFVYLMYGIYWNSETSPLLGDGFHQYVIFDTNLRNILHGTDSIFYTFSSGLGQNFYALSSYYLGSFLSPLVYFFDLKSMPDAVYLFTLIKFGLIGLSAFISVKGIFKKIPALLIITLSTSFSLMSFSVSQLEIKTWLDVFILAPLIILGLHRLITGKGSVLYFTTLSILFIQNYYFGYMMAIFLVFWYLLQLSWDFKNRIKSLLDFTIVSALAGLTSLIMILPTYLDISTHGETLTKVSPLLTEKSWFLDVFAKNFIGSFDTTKYGSIPMIFVGLLPFILTIVFFTLRSIKFHVKLCYATLLIIIIASFYLEALDLFWQGMHAPNMFLHRYAWIFSTLLIYISAEVLNRVKDIKLWNVLFSITLLLSGYLATIYFKNHYSFLTKLNILLTLEFLVVYLLLLLALIKKLISLKIFSILILIFTISEISFNTSSQLNGITKEWGFASRSTYDKDIPSMEAILEYTKQQPDTFTRTEKLQTQTGNDSMKFNYNGISQFSSVRNRSASTTLDKLGFKSSGTNLNLRYANNTIIADSLFGISYNISETYPDKFGFHPSYQKDNLTLYKNQFALPIAFATQSIYKDVTFNDHTLDNQTQFLNQIADLNEEYFSPINHHTDSSDSVVNLNGTDTEDATISYSIEVPDNSQVYLSMTKLNFSNDKKKQVDIIVNGEKKSFTTDNAFTFFNLGYTENKQTFDIQVKFPGNAQVSFESPTFYRLDTKKYTGAIGKIKENPVEVSSYKNKVIVNYKVKNETSIFFTIPYDQGWSAYQNGKKLQIQQAQTGFMKIDVPEGEGTITLSFIPKGFIAGASCSLIAIIVFIFYDIQRKKYSR